MTKLVRRATGRVPAFVILSLAMLFAASRTDTRPAFVDQPELAQVQTHPTVASPTTVVDGDYSEPVPNESSPYAPSQHEQSTEEQNAPHISGI